MRPIHVVVLMNLLAAVCAAPLSAALFSAAGDPDAPGRECSDGRARDDARHSLLAADSALATVAATVGFAAALRDAFSDDVVYLQDGFAILHGRNDATAALDRDRIANATAEWTTLRAEVSADGSRGYTLGRIRVEEFAASPWANSMYLAFWRRAADGRWRIAAYVRNAGPAATAPASAGTEGPRPAPAASDAPRTRGGTHAPGYTTDAAGADALIAADAAFSERSVQRGAATAFGDFAATDAVILAAGRGIVRGPDAIREWFAGMPAHAELRWEPRHAEIAESGDLGFSAGTAIFTIAPPGEPVRQVHSKYITIWKRQDDGSWKYVADAGNGRPAS